MKNENSHSQAEQPKRGKSRTFKIVTGVVLAAAGLVLLLFFGIPLYLSSSGGTDMLLGRINESVDGQVQMGDFSMGWFSGVTLTNLSYADHDGLTSLTVDRVETQPQYAALLGGKVRLGKTVVDNPKVHVKVHPLGQTPEKQDTEKPKSPRDTASAFPIDRMNLQVIDGSATIEIVNDPAQTVQFSNIASNIQIAEAGRPSSLDVSMNVNQESTVSAKGTVTPDKEGWTLKEGDFEVHIDTLDLAGLAPLFALAGQPMDMAGQLNADATVKVSGGAIQRLQADATITDFAQGTGDQRKTFDEPVTLSALLVGSGDTVKIENATVQSAFCTIDCSGTLQSLNYEVDADLAETQSFVGQFTDMQGIDVQGRLSARGKVNMTDARIGVSGTGTARQLVVRKGDVQTPTTELQVEFDGALDQAAEQFQLTSANLTSTPGSVTVSNLAVPLSAQGSKNISLDARAQLDLAKTWPFVQVFTDLPQDMQIAGMLNAAVNAEPFEDAVRLRTDNTQVTNLRITRPEMPPFERQQVNLKGTALWRSEPELDTVEIPTLNMLDENDNVLLKVIDARFERQKNPSSTKLQGDLKAEYDLKTLSSMASPFLPAGLMFEGQRTDTLTFQTQYPTEQPELLNANLNADATFGFDRAEFNGLNAGPTEMKLNVVKGIMDFAIPETTVNEGTLQFAGTLDLKESPRFFRLTRPMPILQNVQVNDTLTRNLLMYTNPVFADAVRTSGIASFTCQQMAIPLSKDHLQQMNIQGTLGIASLKLQAGDLLGQILNIVRARDTAMLTLHPTTFTVNDGFLSYDDMQLDVGSTPLHFAGKIGLDQSLAMTVRIPVSGDRLIPLPLGGTLTSPTLDTERLPGQLIEQEIQRQLERLFQ